MIPWLGLYDPFPPVSKALRKPNGLLAAGANLSVDRLLSAYQQGIFPWYGPDEPILWWSPDPRMVLFPEELRISRSLAKTLRKECFVVKTDENFREVIQACSVARPGQAGTWITGEIQQAYNALHQQGHAHSVEAWQDERLVGGLYGVALGQVFFGESMFSKVSDASKVAFVYLVNLLRALDYTIIDCQMSTSHLQSLGAREIPRDQFVRYLNFDGTRGRPWPKGELGRL